MRVLIGTTTSTRALMLTFLITIVALIVGASLLLYDLRQNELHQAQHQLAGLSRVLADQTTHSLESISLVMRGTRDRLSDQVGRRLDLASFPVTFLLKARVPGLPQLSSIFVLDGKGDLVNSSRSDFHAGISLADRSYFEHFKHNRNDEFFLSVPMHNRLDGEWSIFMSTPVFDGEKELRGILVASIRLDYFSSLYDQIGPDLAEGIELLTEQGVRISGFPKHLYETGSLAPDLHRLKTEPGGDLAKGQVVPVSRNGVSGFAGVYQVSNFPLMISLYTSEQRILAPWRKITITVVLGVGVIAVLSLLATASLMASLHRREALTAVLREQDERLQQLVYSVHDAIVTVDASSTIVMLNEATEMMFGIREGEVTGTSLAHYFDDASVRKLALWLRDVGAQVVGSSDFGLQEVIGLRPDGDKLLLETSLSSATVQGRRYLTLVLRDITERRQAEQALRVSNRQLKELTAVLQRVREDERARVAREIHDELGQLITGIRLELRWLERHLPADRPDLGGKINSLVELLDVTIATVRRITAELHPLILDDLGLAAAAGWLVDQFGQRTGIKVELQFCDADPVRGGQVAIALFRIIQESLTNVAKYAEASFVEIRLRRRADHWHLLVKDNGVGFDADGVRPAGFGLIGMRERAMLLGGDFTVRSALGQGTRIEVTMPIEEDACQG